MPKIVSATEMWAALLFFVVVPQQMPTRIQRGDVHEGCWLSERKVMVT